MGGFVIALGIVMLLGAAFKTRDLSISNKDNKDWRDPLIIAIGGLVLMGIGALMEHFNI